MSVPPEAADDDIRSRVLTAAFQAQRDIREGDWDSSWDDEAEAIADAVWPLIAAAQREADAQLAEKHRAIVIERGTWAHGQPFADLLRAEP